MRDLLVTTYTPVLNSGRAMRTYTLARALAMTGEGEGVDILYRRFGAEQPDEAFRSIRGVRIEEVLEGRGPARAGSYLQARRRAVPSTLARGISPQLARAAARLAAEPGRGRVIADGPVTAASLHRLAGRRAVIYNAHNFESGFRHESGLRSVGSPAELRNFEKALLMRASESWMVSHADMRSARALCPSANLRYVPNAVDVSAIEPVSIEPGAMSAVFVANFAYEPNRTGLEFLLEEVLPLVWEELPGVHLRLVGAGLGELAIADERIEQLGFVDHLGTAYGRAGCAVVPLVHGGGTPLKLVEALAYGMPIVATPRAVAGLDVVAGRDCLVAEDGPAFAAAMIRLLRDGPGELGPRGRELAEHDYSVEALTRLLDPAAAPDG